MITQLSRFVLFLLLPIFGISLHTPVDAQTGDACPPATTITRSELIEQTLDSGGITRTYYLYLPASYDPQMSTPLVLAFHGLGQGAIGLSGYSGWEDVAEAHGFVLVYPQGFGGFPRWESGLFANQQQVVDDVAFTHDMITELSTTLCIDTTRVYANGFSNGGGMSYRLACELADHITAIGGVAGAYTNFGDGCNPSRPVPVILFHGTADSIVPYTGGNPQMFTLPDIETWALGWAERNDCDLTPIAIPQTGDVYGVHYSNCDDDADVVLYTIIEGGHTWPGANITRVIDRFGGYTTYDISASEAMWTFFSQYQRQE